MKFLIVVATLLTQDPPPTDVPARDKVTHAGDVVPFDGYCVEEQEFIKREKVNARNAYMAEEGQKNLLVSPVALVAIVLGALATGVGVAFAGIEIKKQLDKPK